MDKAEEKALESIPIHPNETLEKQRRRFREFFIMGYEQAEKDLALTWEDVANLVSLQLNVMSEYQCETVFSSVEVFKETLRRFNEQRNK